MKGGVIMSLSANKKTRRKKKARISNKRQGRKCSAPNLSPQQISVIAGLLAGFFTIESVIYNRDNVLQIILTTDRITKIPILGPPSPSDVDLQNAIDIDVINEEEEDYLMSLMR